MGWLTCSFLFIQHSGLLHTRGVTGKRERESERDSSGEKDGVACSLNKMQRQSTEVRLLFLSFIYSHHRYSANMLTAEWWSDAVAAYQPLWGWRVMLTSPLLPSGFLKWAELTMCLRGDASVSRCRAGVAWHHIVSPNIQCCCPSRHSKPDGNDTRVKMLHFCCFYLMTSSVLWWPNFTYGHLVFTWDTSSALRFSTWPAGVWYIEASALSHCGS